MALLVGSGSSAGFGAFDKEKFQAQAHKRFIGLVESERRKFAPAATASQTVPSHIVSLDPSAPLTVCVRKRPMNSQERASSQYDVVSCPDRRTVVVHEPKVRYDLSQVVSNHSFNFDRVYGDNSSTLDMYKELLRPLVLDLDRGAQVTCFAYGQTGSGKSYTMAGLVHAVMEDLFRLILAESNRHRGLIVSVAYYEVYCSKCYDLLNDRSVLPLREDEAGRVQVVQLTEHGTRDIRVARELLARGAAARSTGTTKVNADSSRSHSVLQLLVRESASCGGRVVGKCTLVDLAGSEQAHEMEDKIDRAAHHEAAEINKSLLALKECIRAMARGQAQHGKQGQGQGEAQEGGSTGREVQSRASSYSHSLSSSADEQEEDSIDEATDRRGASGPAPARGGLHRQGKAGRPPIATPYGRVLHAGQGAVRRVGAHRTTKKPHVHIPFRGSKLTQILRDCFTTPGAVTVMIATVGPGSVAADHSLNTLRYADRLKGIGRKHAGIQDGSASIAQSVSASGRSTGALCENSASMRTGLLAGEGGRDSLPGGFTNSNPHAYAQPLGLEGASMSGSYGLLPVSLTWPVGTVPPLTAPIWRQNEETVQAMRAEYGAWRAGHAPGIAVDGAFEHSGHEELPSRGSPLTGTRGDGGDGSSGSGGLAQGAVSQAITAQAQKGEDDSRMLAMLDAQIAHLEGLKARVAARGAPLPPPAPVHTQRPRTGAERVFGSKGRAIEVRRPSLLQDALAAASAAVASIHTSVEGGLAASSASSMAAAPPIPVSLTGRQGGVRQPPLLMEARPPAVQPLHSTSALVEVLDARREQTSRVSALLSRQRPSTSMGSGAPRDKAAGGPAALRSSPYAQSQRAPPSVPSVLVPTSRPRTSAGAGRVVPPVSTPSQVQRQQTRALTGLRDGMTSTTAAAGQRPQAPASLHGSPKPEKKGPSLSTPSLPVAQSGAQDKSPSPLLSVSHMLRGGTSREAGRDMEFLRPDVHDELPVAGTVRSSDRHPPGTRVPAPILARPRTALTPQAQAGHAPAGVYPVTVSASAIAAAYRDMDLHNVAGHSTGPVVVGRLASGGSSLQVANRLV